MKTKIEKKNPKINEPEAIASKNKRDENSSPIGEDSKDNENRALLEKCEKDIQQNEGGAFVIGRNLNVINNECLYKTAGSSSFETYCKERWGMSDKHAYRLIEAAKCYDALDKYAKDENKDWVLPRNESQARVLVDYSKDEKKWILAWEKVTKKFQGRAFTAEMIEGVVYDKAKAKAAAPHEKTKASGDNPAKNLAEIDKLVRAAIKKVADKENIPVKSYLKLLEKIKALIEAAKG